MKILFDLRNVGLGNNGGSSTLIKSANTLIELGNEVVFIDNMKNQHKWTPLKAKHIIVKEDKNLPTSDIIIATGYKSVKTTLSAPQRCGIKSHWIRGWETWVMPESNIIKQILKAPTKKFVNSVGLQEKLKTYNINSYLVRPGYDFNELYPTGARYKRDKYIIGALYTTGKHVELKRYAWILETVKYMKSKYSNIELWMMGISHAPPQADKYYKLPNIKQKNEFYNGVDIWLSPSQQEGLHMPPAEAMMTECPVIGNSSPLSGTKDYLIDNYSGLISKNNCNDFIKCVEKLYLNRLLRYNLGYNAKDVVKNIGNRETNMKYFIILIKEFIK